MGFDPKFVLQNTGIQQLKVLAFRKPEFKADEPLKTSLLGTPIYTNLEIPAGNFKDLDGNVVEFEGITIDTVIMTISASKNVITTAVAGRPGTVKEFASDGDFAISIDGKLFGEQQNVYPQEEVTNLIEVCRVPETLKVISEFLDFFDIQEIVITDYELAQLRGSRNQQDFRISALSDKPLELR